MPLRTQTDLLTLAGRYANERRVPASTIIKEILHYEILFALTQSGAASHLAFQGGTALRLCYQGTRYSEDLDFACGKHFAPETMTPFADVLRKEIGDAYGLQVDIRAPKEKAPSDGVTVSRWSAKVHVPQADPSVAQNQVINIEVASVPAHDVDLVAVAANYPHLPSELRQLIVAAETPNEILADKLVALGARPFLKARDLWDIKFLSDRRIAPNIALIAAKLSDYGWTEQRFKEKLEAKLIELAAPDTVKAFHQEMSRFVDAGVASQLANAALVAGFLRRSRELAIALLSANLSVQNNIT
ncbi:hypothetical protein PTE30175_01968 [Pandoraea terrae]|uniref:Nucleotidyl transferase AbiEii/AbiGii toxin family protein n=1 Tax=Pandoraea terrae TaxID=1537710 RepID=A0A5E4UIE0_9BURK|nr:nucleotidyl transferase AbiEii/AbiGii toxin family protein [Pandoraea terrae]VVD99292.1 hypothetical protein PTE30175_01968 [Pandoraea terrae]